MRLVTALELAEIMGKSRMWITRGIRSGLFHEVGIIPIYVPRRGKGGVEWFLLIPPSFK